MSHDCGVSLGSSFDTAHSISKLGESAAIYEAALFTVLFLKGPGRKLKFRFTAHFCQASL